MTRQFFMFSVLVMSALVTLTSCGISKAEYYNAIKESSGLKAQLAKIQDELTVAQQNLITVTKERDAAVNQLNRGGSASIDNAEELIALNARLSTTQTSLYDLKNSVKTFQSYVQIATTYFAFAAISDSGAQNDVIVAFGNIETAVAATQDATMKTAWKAVWDASANNQNTDVPMAEFIRLLGQRLTELKPKIS
jgi:hypothetical protein